MELINKFEKEKLLHLLEYSSEELDDFVKKSLEISKETSNIYDTVLKILQKGYNIREAVLIGILLGEKIGYENAKKEMEQEIKDKLYRAFKNNQL
ncbi:MAG: hypothetical protein CMD04_05625 [Flavobacteriales bacterium]|nr:hypothetical protein [Flavobacteriales bacterium]MAN50277.1 hypothetical protein [Flavobacteriales bacterium]|tara:strand:+ start:810 stop:1094 length:285 start_codon:yes stop_codon:yes gene_type:complete